jgi:hypothetical protein
MVSSRINLVVEKLANAGKYGCADPEFIARFLPELLDLVKEQLATAEREIRIVRGQLCEFARVKLTNKGLHIFKGRLSPHDLDGDFLNDAVMTRRKAPNPTAGTRRCGSWLRGHHQISAMRETRCMVSLRRPARSPCRT